MAVPISMTDLSTSEGSNYPPDSETVTAATRPSDYLRALGAIMRTLAASDTIASATTTDLSTKYNTFITVTGVTAITGLGTVSAGIYKVLIFDGALTLTHNATSLILPGSANITTAQGDTAFMLSLGSGNWRCLNYMKKSGAPIGSYQPLDATLTALASTLTTANRIPYATNTDTAGELTFNPSTALAASTSTVPSQTVVKTAIDDLIANCTEATPVASADYFVFEDATDNTQKKALLSTISSVSASSLLNNGYLTLSNGIIIQWGEQTVAAATTSTYSFPLTFPTACLQFVAGTDINGSAGASRNDSTGGVDISTSQYQLRQGSASSTLTIRWIAVGY